MPVGKQVEEGKRAMWEVYFVFLFPIVDSLWVQLFSHASLIPLSSFFTSLITLCLRLSTVVRRVLNLGDCPLHSSLT